MPTEPQPVTLAEVVRRAGEVCDPAGQDPDITDLIVRFEDADEPVTAVGDIEQRLAEEAGAIDPQAELPAVVMASAVAVYLAHRRDELNSDREEILRLAARAEFDGDPPPAIADWLGAQGIST